MTNLDVLHGPVCDTQITECAWVFIHEDGYKEVVYNNEMETQPVQCLD